MSAALSVEKAERRAFPRHPVHMPLDVIVLRSGVPENLPGRCTDLSETGVGAVIAGELVPDQQVAVELRLPNVGVPVCARALVRYQEQLRCGIQFVGLPAEQREMIRYWLYRAAQHAQGADIDEAPKADSVAVAGSERRRRIRVRQRGFYVLAVLMVLLAGLAWWRWQRSWNELEARAAAVTQAESPIRVSSEIMERKILYKTNPVYPEAARAAREQGRVVMDVVIGVDGTVRRVRTVSGSDLLAQPAADAVQSWKFEPYWTDGKPVEVETTMAVDFRLK